MVNRHDPGGCLIVPGGDTIRLSSKLDAGDVTKVKNGPIGIGAQDDVPKLLRLDQAPLCAHRVSELLTFRNRLAANLARRIDIILGLYRVNHICCRDPELGKLVRVYPDAKRILSSENLHARDALHARELVLKIDHRVVGKEVLAQLAAR